MICYDLLQGDHCTLKVSGYVRGPSFNVNGLVHLQGWGDFQMKQIDITADPHPLNENKKVSLGFYVVISLRCRIH